VTTADAVAECGEITLDESIPARVVGRDAGLNLACSSPQTELARGRWPVRAARRGIGSRGAVAGFPYGRRCAAGDDLRHAGRRRGAKRQEDLRR
jgi:hypothetical protein